MQGTRNEQDILTGALIGLARACTSNPRTGDADRVLVEGLAGSLFQKSGDEKHFPELTRKVKEEKDRIAPGCAMCTARCGNTDDYDMERLWNTGGKDWTYEYKYRRGGKTLCCLYSAKLLVPVGENITHFPSR